MTQYQDQGEGELVPGRGFTIVSIFSDRHHIPTAIEFNDGAILVATVVSHSRDIGEEWELIYFEADGQDLVAGTSEIVRLTDPVSGSSLYERVDG